jgi:hypothetical protein
MNVLEQVLLPVQAEEVVFPVPSAVPFSSSRSTPSRNVAIDGALPEKVTVTVLMATDPAASAVKLNFAMSSAEDLVLPEAKPLSAPEKTTLVLKSVWVLLFAEDKVTEVVVCEVLPRATTVSFVVSLVVSVEVAILKM